MILRAIKQLVSPEPMSREAHEVYALLVMQARLPRFYRELMVEDTLDGRFDIILLHLFLVIHRLHSETDEAANRFIRVLSEVFFADMDRSLREMGVGDTGVSTRIKKMAQAFYGRLAAYEKDFQNVQTFEESLARNLYRGRPVDRKILETTAAYIRQNAEHLKTQPLAGILNGTIVFLS